jgi:hypothetical protein
MVYEAGPENTMVKKLPTYFPRFVRGPRPTEITHGLKERDHMSAIRVEMHEDISDMPAPAPPVVGADSLECFEHEARVAADDL